jgi:hypothetical protein
MLPALLLARNTEARCKGSRVRRVHVAMKINAWAVSETLSALCQSHKGYAVTAGVA